MADSLVTTKADRRSMAGSYQSYTPTAQRHKPNNQLNRSLSVASIKEQHNVMSKGDAFNNLPPLQRFGRAKTEVNDIYRHIAKFIGDGCTFLQDFNKHSQSFSIDLEEVIVKLKGFADQVTGIQEMLTRDQMKVNSCVEMACLNFAV